MSSVGKKSTYLIVENKILPNIFQPLKSNRIKYTCFEVSRNFLILGATSGGLYVFKRDPCVFLQLIPNKEGAVNSIALSLDERLIAFSTNKGITCVLELHEGDEARLINRSLEHSGSVVTCLVWARNTNQLYVGDNIGRLSVINVSLFLNKNIFHVPAYMFMKLDSGVVQISCYEEYLLVSTKTRCYICDTTKEKYKQIGTQLREGAYGATFLNSNDGLKIYCARPGSRLWEADVSGNVKSTHQFKKALATQSVALVKIEEGALIHKFQSSWPDQSFNFCTLLGLFDKYLFTFKSDGVYIFDPRTAEVVLWSDHYNDIVDAKCINDIVYLWTSVGKIHSFIITPLNKCLVQLYFLGKYQLCVDILERFIDHAKSFNIMSKITCLVGLKDHLPNISKNSKLSSFIEKLLFFAKEKQLSNLDSGIFLVDHKHWKKWKLNATKSKNTKQKKITRSHSLTDLRKVSVKCNNLSNSHSDYCSAVSLPEMQLSMDEVNLNSSSCNILNDPPLLWSVPLSGSFFHQIPFLSLTSPDLIQSTILELGQSVKNKLAVSSRSLQNKWHLIEEKLKISKELHNYETHNTENNINADPKMPMIINMNHDDIVYQPSSNEVKKCRSIDVSHICAVCEKVSAGNKNEDSINLFFDKVIEQMVLLNQNSTGNENLKRTFPFKELIPLKYHQTIKDLFSLSFKHCYITKYLPKLKKYELNFFYHYEHPNLLKQMHMPDDLNNDLSLSNFIVIFSEIIDPDTILDYLEYLDLPCTFFSWSIIIDVFQDNAFSFFAEKKDSNYLECPLPFLLNILFLMLRLEQIESSCHMARNANLKLYHISYLILKLSLHLEFTGIKYQNCIDKCNKLFLNCLLDLLMNDSVSIKELYDPEILFHIEFSFFQVIKPPTHRCSCNYPLLGQSKKFSKYLEIGQILLSVYLTPFKNIFNYTGKREGFDGTLKFISDQYEENGKIKLRQNIIMFIPRTLDFRVEYLYPNNNIQTDCNIKQVYLKIIALLQTVPGLLSILVYSFQSNFSLNYLPFIVQFGKIEDVIYLDCKNNMTVWKEIFVLNMKLSNGICCICQNKAQNDFEVDWNKTFVLALKYLGSFEALKLMVSSADFIPPDGIDFSVFRIFFLKNLMEKEGADENNISLIDTYYEKMQSGKSSFSKESSSTELLNIKETVNTGNTLTMEIDVNRDLCCQCSLVLSSDNVSEEHKIRAFRCKHVFHVLCLRLAKSLFDCPICVKKNSCKL